MLTLGIGGNLYGELWHERPINVPHRSYFEGNHDSAAVLLKDGEVVAAIEQERLDRIKHSGSFPADAIRACLEIGNCSLQDVDMIAFSYSLKGVEDSLARCSAMQACQGGIRIERDVRRYYAQAIKKATGEVVNVAKFRFVKHHIAHIAGAFWSSGFDKALVVSIDGHGEDQSGCLCLGNPSGIELLQSFSDSESLGIFYLRAMSLLGFRLFEEYKVMGLAPYGDAARFRKDVQTLYTLLPEGRYALHLHKLADLVGDMSPRLRSDPILQVHEDFAASVQEALEVLVFHVVKWGKSNSNQKHLCLAGGVAHNCTLNGKLLESQLFDQIYVHPAAHDGGLALGAAMSAFHDETSNRPKGISHMFLGKDIGQEREIGEELAKWFDFIVYKNSSRIVEETASALANGEVLGWVQHRSEYGPRALGNRSILADPRPSSNRERINQMIKKRESFRPFAPAVKKERAHEFFDLTPTSNHSFMTFVTKVRPEWQSKLGAVTHTNGTARLQTISASQNRLFWQLLSEFEIITGIPVLLNTSFNNNAEPIVDSVYDAIASFLTTGLDGLIVGNFFVRKRDFSVTSFDNFIVQVPCHLHLTSSLHQSLSGATDTLFNIEEMRSIAGSQAKRWKISSETWIVLSQSNGKKRVKEICQGLESRRKDEVLAEIIRLWSDRAVRLLPPISLNSAS